MPADKVWDDFRALPAEAQQQAADFIAFLQQRYGQGKPIRREALTRLSKESYVGMWGDREDLRDSAEWVRDLRQREWTG
jgi:hypothetical protein